MARLRERTTATALALTSIAAVACRSSVPIEYQTEPIPAVIGCDADQCPPGNIVRVTYLGVAGFLIEANGHALLTGPSFTNPSFDSVAPRWLRFFRAKPPTVIPNRALIDRLLPPAASSASMILVGHGHYDHLLDVPHIATTHARDAVIYGGPTVRHMLMGDSTLRASPQRVVAIAGTDVARRDHMGRWFTSADGAFRVMALEADHAPAARVFLRRVDFATGTVDKDLDHLPRSAEDWKLGEPYAFIIDVLGADATTPVFRIYFQDAPNTVARGVPPSSLGGRRIDVAILCVATSRNVDPPAPDSLLRVLKPRFVIASHWESFFRPQTLPLMLNPASDVDAFNTSLMKNLLADARWAMPAPRAVLRFAAKP